MGDRDKVVISTRIDWLQAHAVVLYFLDPAYKLPVEIADKQLVDLMTACAKAQKRLRKKIGD